MPIVLKFEVRPNKDVVSGVVTNRDQRETGGALDIIPISGAGPETIELLAGDRVAGAASDRRGNRCDHRPPSVLDRPGRSKSAVSVWNVG